MRSKLAIVILSGVLSPCLGAFSVGSAADPPREKITYEQNVAVVFRSRCGSCHNPDKQKGGLISIITAPPCAGAAPAR